MLIYLLTSIGLYGFAAGVFIGHGFYMRWAEIFAVCVCVIMGVWSVALIAEGMAY